MGEGVGFEPTEDAQHTPNSFQDYRNKPNSANPPYLVREKGVEPLKPCF